MKIKSVGLESILDNHLYLSKIVFGEDSKAVRYLEQQIKIYGKDANVYVEERKYFAFLQNLNSKVN